MRKLLLLRGLPGSGKSTFVANNGLTPYTLSADAIRMTYGSPIMLADGTIRIPGDYDRNVWAQLLQMLDTRMSRGEFVVIDATHAHPRSFSNYQSYATKHRYQVACLDFNDVPFEVCQQRNMARDAYQVVPPIEMERMNDNLQRSILPKWIERILPADLDQFLVSQPVDVSKYEAVHNIGDIQGCFDPLMKYFDAYGINDNHLYVFVGDYLDRGTQNAQVMNWLLDNYHRPNFIFVEGNHEAHLRQWARGAKPRSAQFNQATAVELEAANIQPKKVYGFLYKLREFYYYTHNDRTVFACHGGISTIPDKLTLMSSMQVVKGTGAYEDVDVSDTSFTKLTYKDTYLVHGHRNKFNTPTQSSERTFNLEGKVEFGGQLRVVVLTADGWTEQSVDSTIDATGTIIERVGDKHGSTDGVDSLVQQLRASNDVYEKPQPDTEISSFNFKRDVFYKKSWDDLNVHARGLFVNTSDMTIVARSYEKFFNVGERPETQPDVLVRTIKYPVKAWVKENGYLGLIGFDHRTDSLVFASKSSLTSDFAGWLQTQFDALAPEGSSKRKEISDYLRKDVGKTLVFEVIEPQNDPHIIAYDTPRLILLDVVHNSVRFTAVSQTERNKIGKLLNCDVKQLARLIKDADDMTSWLASLKNFDYTLNGTNIEGFVLQAKDDYLVKVKLPWYSFWRQMRTQLDKVNAGKKAVLPNLEINHDLAQSFVDYLNAKQPEELTDTNIVTLRDKFLGAKGE